MHLKGKSVTTHPLRVTDGMLPAASHTVDGIGPTREPTDRLAA